MSSPPKTSVLSSDPVIEIREMNESDLPMVIKLENQLFPNPWPDYSFRADLDSSNVQLWVITAGAEIVGYAVLYIAEDKIQIANFAIASEYQKKGLGTELMEFILKAAKKTGCRYCYLEVRAGNSQAINLYLKFGFVVTGVQRNYYEKPVEDALIMTITV